jgi:hypothetical protein
MKYTFFADESGQSGIKVLRSSGGGGASRYMTLGGALVPNGEIERIGECLASLAQLFSRPDLHCNKLNHNQTVRFAKEAASLRIKLFGVISLKETLGDYKDAIRGDDKYYYNKCAQYLLERLGHFMSTKGISEDDLSIHFEKGNFNYAALRSLISKCRANPFWPATRFLQQVNPQSILTSTKSQQPLLQLGDLVAHALFRCVDDGPTTFGVVEPRYVRELRKSFFSDDETGLVCGFGIHPVHTLEEISATSEITAFLKQLSTK